jgi:hypothetical protein
MASLTVRAKLPIGEADWGSPSLLVKWAANQGDHKLTRTIADMRATLWIDRDCIIGPPKEDEMLRYANLRVSFIKAELHIAEIDDTLAQFIYDEREAPKTIHHGIQPSDLNYEPLKAAYASLGKRVHAAFIETENRLLAFCRVHKGQYWISEHPPLDHWINSFNVQSNAAVSLDGRKWVRWCPPLIDSITANIPDERRILTPNDWAAAQTFISGTGKPSLSRELLSNAERFVEEREFRSAIVESICALEVALNEFVTHPNDDVSIPSPVRDLIAGASLERISDNLGLTGTVSMLLPLLLPQTSLTPELLRTCCEAIGRRQNVVHNGQRRMDCAAVRREVRAIREVCELLQNHTKAIDSLN